jgi:hypothetical protein
VAVPLWWLAAPQLCAIRDHSRGQLCIYPPLTLGMPKVACVCRVCHVSLCTTHHGRMTHCASEFFPGVRPGGGQGARHLFLGCNVTLVRLRSRTGAGWPGGGRGGGGWHSTSNLKTGVREHPRQQRQRVLATNQRQGGLHVGGPAQPGQDPAIGGQRLAEVLDLVQCLLKGVHILGGHPTPAQTCPQTTHTKCRDKDSPPRNMPTRQVLKGAVCTQLVQVVVDWVGPSAMHELGTIPGDLRGHGDVPVDSLRARGRRQRPSVPNQPRHRTIPPHNRQPGHDQRVGCDAERGTWAQACPRSQLPTCTT